MSSSVRIASMILTGWTEATMESRRSLKRLSESGVRIAFRSK
jgi:hypothetical protein